MRIKWSNPAEADLDDIVRYIAPENLVAALELEEQIVSAVSKLSSMPLRGRVSDWPDHRELVVRGTPYLAIYTVATDEVFIVRIVHGAQNRTDGRPHLREPRTPISA